MKRECSILSQCCDTNVSIRAESSCINPPLVTIKVFVFEFSSIIKSKATLIADQPLKIENRGTVVVERTASSDIQSRTLTSVHSSHAR